MTLHIQCFGSDFIALIFKLKTNRTARVCEYCIEVFVRKTFPILILKCDLALLLHFFEIINLVNTGYLW